MINQTTGVFYLLEEELHKRSKLHILKKTNFKKSLFPSLANSPGHTGIIYIVL